MHDFSPSERTPLVGPAVGVGQRPRRSWTMEVLSSSHYKVVEGLLDPTDDLLVQGRPIEKAAVLVDQAVDGEAAPTEILDDCHSEAAMKAYLAYQKLNLVNMLALQALLGLLFFEAPPWCGNKLPDIKKYSMWRMPFLHHYQVAIIQAVCIAILGFRAYLSWVFVATDDSSRRLLFAKVALLLGLSLDCAILLVPTPSGLIANLHIGYYFRAPAVVAFHREMRETFVAFLKMATKWVDIGVLVFVYMAVYAWFGMLIFHGTAEGDKWFKNYPSSLYHMFALLSFCGTPPIQLLAYEQNRCSVMFFAGFLLIGIFLLMNLMLAVIYDAYKSEVVKQLVREDRMREKNLQAAFRLLDQEDRGFVDSNQVLELFQALGRFRNLPSGETMRLYFEALDTDHDYKVTLPDFMEICDVVVIQFDKLDEGDHFIKWHFPSLYKSDGFQLFAEFVQSEVFNNVVDVMLFFNVVVIVMEGVTLMNGHSTNTFWMRAVAVFGFLYVVEMIVRMLAWGPGRAWRSFRSRLDFAVTLGICCIFFVPSLSFSWIRYLEIARVLRLLRILGYFRRFKIIVRTFVRLVPAMGPLMGVLVCLLCLYCAVGVQVFGGLIYVDNPDLKGGFFVTDHFLSRNFNDFASGMVTMFDLLMGPSWMAYMETYATVTHRPFLTRTFFFSFYIIGVVLMLNLVVAFVLSAFVTQMKVEEAMEAERKKVLEEERSAARASTSDEGSVSSTRSSTMRPHRNSTNYLKVLEAMFKQEVESAKRQRRRLSSSSI